MNYLLNISGSRELVSFCFLVDLFFNFYSYISSCLVYGVPTKNVCFCQAWHATTQVMTSGQLNSSITSPKGFSPIFFPKLRWFTWNAEVFVWRLFEVMIELTLTKWYFRQGCLWRMSWGKSESIRSLRPSFDWVKVHDYCTICNPTFWEYTIKLHDIFSQPKIFTVNLGVYIYIYRSHGSYIGYTTMHIRDPSSSWGLAHIQAFSAKRTPGEPVKSPGRQWKNKSCCRKHGRKHVTPPQNERRKEPENTPKKENSSSKASVLGSIR